MSTTTTTKSESSKITDKLLAAREAGKQADAAEQAASDAATANSTEPKRKPYRAPRPKQTRPAGPRKRLPLTIGGVEVSYDDTVAAIEVLEAAPGIMVRQPLVKARSPLSECDYHAVANKERETSGSERMATKEAFVWHLRKLTGR